MATKKDIGGHIKPGERRSTKQKVKPQVTTKSTRRSRFKKAKYESASVFKKSNRARTYILKNEFDKVNIEALDLKSIFNHVKKNVHSISYDWNDDSRAYELLTVIREGFDYRTFQNVANNTPLDSNDWSMVLGTTNRTLERYKKDNKTFNSSQTEKIIEIQQLMYYGTNVFGSDINFNQWLLRENTALGGIVPKDLLDTTIGIGMIKDAIGRIEHGIFA